MNLKFWKKENKEKGSKLHDKLDSDIEGIPEINHDILLGLLENSDKIADDKFLSDKYGLTSIVTREYVNYLTQKELLNVNLTKDGKIDTAELTEKGKLFLEGAKQEKTVETKEP